MGLVDNFRNWFGSSIHTTYDSKVLNKVGEFSGYDRNKIAQLYYDQNKANFAVYSVINYCAEAIADTLRYAKIVNKKQDEVTDHWSYNLLLDNPNEFSNTSEFGKAYAVNRLLFGDTYVYMLRGIGLSEGRIKEMIVAHTQDVSFADNTQYNWMRPKQRYQIPVAGVPRTFEPEEILRVSSYNADNSDYGLSPLIPAAILAEKILNGSISEAMMFKNGGTEVILTNKQVNEGRSVVWGSTDLERFNHELNDKNGKRLKLVNSAMDKIDIGKSPIDLGILNSTDAGLKALMFVYRLPYSLYSGDGTFNNTREGYKALYTQVGLPYAKEFLDKFTQVCGFKNGEYWTIDEQLIPQLKEDAANTLTAYDKAYASINERRAVIGLEPLTGDEYNKPLVPMNMVSGLDTGLEPIE
jgi:HK97 family phage portal protein